MRIFSRNSGFYRQLLRSGPVSERPLGATYEPRKARMFHRSSPQATYKPRKAGFVSDRSRHWEGGKNAESCRNKLPRTARRLLLTGPSSSKPEVSGSVWAQPPGGSIVQKFRRTASPRQAQLQTGAPSQLTSNTTTTKSNIVDFRCSKPDVGYKSHNFHPWIAISNFEGPTSRRRSSSGEEQGGGARR